VIRVQAQIRELESTLKRERENLITRIRNDFQAALRREKLLSTAYASQAMIVSEKAKKSVNYDILRREVDSNRRMYDELLQKVQGAGLASAMNASNVRVVDPAWPPEHPYKPNLYLNLLMGLASGALLGIAFVVVADHVNRSLKSPGETPFHLKVPDAANGRVENMELVTWQNRPSLIAESFRSTLASILVAERNGQRPRVLLVTSAGRGEGKSTTVSNLGIALAEINQKVLLVDADMRKPHLHQIFNAPNTWGLSDLLREKTPLKDMPVEALARETEISGLHILPSGPGTLSIANLLYSHRMSELLQKLRAEFDMVLIDTPPMLYISDARVLGRLADGAILVVRAGQTTRDDAMGAKQRLVDDGIHVLGTILNGWDSKARTRYGYYAYHHRDGEAS
jgi:capsular exopolysaccharide synthesis family protein